MRVGQTGSNQVQGQGETKRTGKAGAAADAKDTKEAKDAKHSARLSDDVNADISAKGKEFAHAKALASDAPDVREDRIAELKRRIEQGKYGVDAGAVADRMVDEHLRTADMG